MTGPLKPPTASKKQMQKAISTIQSFSRFYQGITLQWEKNLLCRGYDLYQIRTLLELYFLGVCTTRELASRLDSRVEKMNHVLIQLQGAKLIQVIADDKDWFFGQVSLTDDGKAEAKKLQIHFDGSIASALERMGQNERMELVHHLKRAKEILQEVEIRKCEVKAKVFKSEVLS